MPIALDNKKFTLRVSEIRKLLLPLSKNNNSVAAKVAIAQRGSIVIGAFSGSSPSSTNHKEWFFKTHNDIFKGSYFEVWVEEPKVFVLEKAYFSLLINEENKYKEVLALHIDPSEKNLKYKSGPHIHVKTSNDLISKAHICLNISDLVDVIGSYEKFRMAYKNALTMINEEIISKTVS